MGDTPIIIITPPEETEVPSSGEFMEKRPSGVPAGLEEVEDLDGFRIQVLMKAPPENVFTTECVNRYEVLDTFGERLYFATRNPEILNGCCCRRRPLIQWLDLSGEAIMTLTPRTRCECFSFGFGYLKLKLRSGNGEDGDCADLGSITRVECCTPRAKFVIRDETGDVVAIIKSPICADLCGVCRIGECCCVTDFLILEPDGVTEMGVIQQKSKNYEIMSGEKCFTLDVTFDEYVEPRVKTLVMAGAFVVDDAYFGITPQGHW